MERVYPTLKDWSVALETAAYGLLAGRIAEKLYPHCRVYVEPCPKHGPGCARVVYGMLLDHVCWAGEDPVRLAERLVATMLPPSASPHPPSPCGSADPFLLG